MKFVIAAGGTGGHIYPGVALAKELQMINMKNEILFIGSSDGIERSLVERERFSIVTIKSRGMLRKLSLRSLSAPFVSFLGFLQSIKILKEFKPDAVIVTGGYVSLPVAFAAFFKRIPLLLHEENTKPGLSARIIKWFAKVVTLSFEESKKYFKLKRKVYCFGNPVRREVINSVRGIAIQNLGLRQDKKIILVLGGSQGARSINKVIQESIPLFETMNIQLVHVTGERDYDSMTEKNLDAKYPFYRIVKYMHNIADGYAAADLVISRAGATTITELAVKGVPSILIPFPFSSEGHQDSNANVMVEAGASRLIKDKELTPQKLIEEAKSILDNKDMFDFMKNSAKNIGKPEAGSEIVKLVYNMTGQSDVLNKKRGRKAKSEQK